LDPARLIERYHASCLAGDVAAGIRLLAASHAAESEKLRRLRRKVTRRFVLQVDPPRATDVDPLVADMLETYHEYYRYVLLKLKTGPRAEALLQAKLSHVARKHRVTARHPPCLDSLEAALRDALHARGCSSLFGLVRPFRSLLLWRTESVQNFRVTLPESVQEVRVHLLDDFLTGGWLDFATFGKLRVGGWAKHDALYCVAKAYRIGSPTFVTSYLTHEAQHFSDYKRFPRLQGADLEFRAKLAELSVSPSPLRLLKRFEGEALDRKELPHSYASHVLRRELARASPSIEPADGIGSKLTGRRLRSAAARTLFEHSARLERMGARRVRGCI
jgi:hypothetical protein